MRTKGHTTPDGCNTYSRSSGHRPNTSFHSLPHCSRQYQRRPGTSRLSRTLTTTKASRRSVWLSMYLSVSLSSRAYQNFIMETHQQSFAKGAKNMQQRGKKGKESNVHIPIADRLPIGQELRLVDHWQRWVHIRKVQIDKAFLNMHRRHCDVMFLLQQMRNIVFGAGPFVRSR